MPQPILVIVFIKSTKSCEFLSQKISVTFLETTALILYSSRLCYENISFTSKVQTANYDTASF